jgi:putative membrane protein
MKTPTCCKLNLNVVFQAFILGGYSIMFLFLLKTGKIRNFLHPRIIPYIAFTAIAFLLMMVFLFRSFKKREHKFKLAPFFLFTLPLILTFLVPSSPASASPLSFSSNKIVGISSIQRPSNGISSGSSSNSGGSQLKLKPNQKAVKVTSAFGASVTLIITDNTISMDDQNIVAWVNELNSHPGNYSGMKIEYTGYVYKSGNGFKCNQFVPSRNMMWCCAADIQLIGVLCQYDKAPELKENSWVHVTGKLSTSTYQNTKVPIIVNPTIKPASVPKTEYVYPY